VNPVVVAESLANSLMTSWLTVNSLDQGLYSSDTSDFMASMSLTEILRLAAAACSTTATSASASALMTLGWLPAWAVKRSRVTSPGRSSNTGRTSMPTLSASGATPTMVVLMRTPSRSSTTARAWGISSVNSGMVGMRATVKL
jgi:hypothetical protein